MFKKAHTKCVFHAFYTCSCMFLLQYFPVLKVTLMKIWKSPYLLTCSFLFLLQYSPVLKGATKSYFMHYSCVVIILLNTGLWRSAFSIIYFGKLVFCLSVVSAVFWFESNVLNQDIRICVLMLCNFATWFCSHFMKTHCSCKTCFHFSKNNHL